ncbi:MAG: RNA pseudouridine synthase [Spirochaetia bacterium]|nr:RNA pseudouridine synthase [Spirochaetia bacterium]
MSLRILKTAADYLIVYKPAGLPFHEDSEQPGVMQLLRAMEEAGQIPEGERIFPVHRLDTMTSGILVFARGRKAANQLGNEFRFSRVEKIYAAISDRAPTRVMGTISGDMEKSRDGSWKLLRTTNSPSITHFLSYPYKHGRNLRLFLLRPRTGKTHQIRVVLKSIGSPVLGDGRYGGYAAARSEKRGYLHAIGIRFKIGEKTVTWIEPPTEGEEFLTPEFRMTLHNAGNLFEIKWPGLKPKWKEIEERAAAKKEAAEGRGKRGSRKPGDSDKPAKRKKKRPSKRRGNEDTLKPRGA